MKRMMFIIAFIFISLSVINPTKVTFAKNVTYEFNALFEHNASVMIVINLDSGTIEKANQAAYEYYGYSKDEFMQMKAEDLGFQLSRFYEMKQIKGHSKHIYYIEEHMLFDGEIRNVKVYPCEHYDGDKNLLFVIIYDVTDELNMKEKTSALTLGFFTVLTLLILSLVVLSGILFWQLNRTKRLNKELKHHNLLRTTFVNASHSLIQLKDENLNYIFVNKAFEEFYQKKEEEIIGKDDFQLIDYDFACHGKSTDLSAIKKKSVIVNELKWGDKILKVTKFPVKLPNNQYGVGGFIDDITVEYNNRNDLLEALAQLNQSQNKLRMVLDSVAEGIFGIDQNGICTFCNDSCLKLLGYNHQEELIGKNIHKMIHHSRKAGTPYKEEECKILSVFHSGVGVHADDEVFWRKDGSSFEVEYYSDPEYQDGELIGVVVTFFDITKRKEEERNIIYNSYHDSLTGLFNRRFLEKKMKQLVMEDNLPISVIMGDVNGLKHMNDIFGHAAGDDLIKHAADIIKKNCRLEDIAFRLGGDEFLMILPRTSLEDAEKISSKIREELSKIKIQSFHGSISLGASTMTSKDEDIIHTIDIADSKMYQQKTVDMTKFNENAVDDILKKLYEVSPSEKEHSDHVIEICEKIGKAMNLSSSESRRLLTAARYHDIGKIIIEPKLLNKKTKLTYQEIQLIRRHPVVGYRILNLSIKTLDIAKYVLSHHESWDGNGYPNHLKGNEIPKISRILLLADVYDRMLHGSYDREPISKEEAMKEIQAQSGKKFDPEIVDIFMELYHSKEI